MELIGIILIILLFSKTVVNRVDKVYRDFKESQMLKDMLGDDEETNRKKDN